MGSRGRHGDGLAGGVDAVDVPLFVPADTFRLYHARQRICTSRVDNKDLGTDKEISGMAFYGDGGLRQQGGCVVSEASYGRIARRRSPYDAWII